MFDYLLTNGRIVDGSGNPYYYGDVALRGERIAAVGRLGNAEARERIDATGLVLAPGFIDTHVHGDLALLNDPQHEPAIRQGVTTYLIGQDGVAMAPASPATFEHMTRYTAGFSGKADLLAPIVQSRGFLSVADYLALFDKRCALNVAYLVPNGNVRAEVMGLDTREATPDELQRMRELVRQGMEQGAVGLSSGLDYIPSRYATTHELAQLCAEIAPCGGVYVTHMRRYDPEGVLAAMDEVYEIGTRSGAAVHISHFNSQAALALPKIDAGRAAGIDVTYDLYCYLAGSSILAMVALPPQVQEGGVDATLARLKQPAVRAKLREVYEGPRGPIEDVRISYIDAAEFRHFEGRTLGEAAAERKQPVSDFVCDVILSAGLAAGCVAPHRFRNEDDVRALMKHPAHMAGSDGIYTGSRPHPRGYGCFARYLGHYVRAGVWSLEQAVQHLAGHAAVRYGLRDRGLLRAGMAADVIAFNAAAVHDLATFDDGRQLATGMKHVFVNGVPVLRDEKRTQALPGRPLRSC
ncbi:MAG: amidohydrolase family protein [Gemmataceae bacterium]